MICHVMRLTFPGKGRDVLLPSLRSLFDDKQRFPNEAVLVPIARERIAVYSVISERRLSFELMAVIRYTAVPTVVTMLSPLWRQCHALLL
jgi:hypothetical protein